MDYSVKAATAGGIDIAFHDEGRGPAIVLLHGYPFNRSMWGAQIEALRGNHRVIAPDLRGFGQTNSSDQIATMDGMARDVASLMDVLKVGSAIICGLSMAGFIAFEFAQLFPSRVRGLVLAGTRAPADNNQEKQSREQQARCVLAEGMQPVAESMLPKLLASRTRAEKPEVVTCVREMILRTRPAGAAAAQRGMAARRDYSNELRDIDVPSLIVSGREDTIRPVSDAEFMHRAIRDSRLEVIEDAAHLMNMEQPAVFNRALLGFVKLIH